ncbi:MAG: FkbM family methyltransferase [Thermoproteales archaeon]|nr:FkbM family methyltransferase [Thermoproteales archaeon]
MYESISSDAHSAVSKRGRSFIVNAITLEDIVTEFGKIDLLKLDIEGAEFKILRNFDLVSDMVDYIVMEVHMKYGNINKIVETLSKLRYEVQKFYPPLVKKCSNSSLKVENLTRLKLFRKSLYLLYFLTKSDYRSPRFIFSNKNAMLLFAIPKR